jgi:hypothetical protein
MPSGRSPPFALGIITRGVNPWRRCLGAAVFGYELTTIL